MKLLITFLTLILISSSASASSPTPNAALSPITTAAGNTNCSASSSNTTFQLTFISYGNWTASSSQNDNPIQHLESVSFAVSNAANEVSTVCAFSLSDNPGFFNLEDGFPLSVSPPWAASVGGNGIKIGSRGKDDAYSSTEAAAEWQACADRKDTDGKHRFTIATSAAFGLVGQSLAVNQTWFCHDDVGRLVAFTGVASAVLNTTCSESEVSGYHLRNCTSPDLALPVTLL
ncbi:hypothetical protein HD806DRAFT_473592 [Xylariaceae sp. AK1471]|nr:hypothetical protein HD806DRAFT_473592 [Xylariaceae sp. AK1471]